jgi:hypothetical protein
MLGEKSKEQSHVSNHLGSLPFFMMERSNHAVSLFMTTISYYLILQIYIKTRYLTHIPVVSWQRFADLYSVSVKRVEYASSAHPLILVKKIKMRR